MTNMKHVLLLVSLLILLPTSAQDKKDDRREQIKKRKIAFITDEVDLTSEEAEKFWPVYNEMEDKMIGYHKEKRQVHKSLKNLDDLSDDEAYSKLEELHEIELKELNARKDYLVKFEEILGKKKAVKVYIAEEKFKNWLKGHLHKDRPPPGGGGGPQHDRRRP